LRIDSDRHAWNAGVSARPWRYIVIHHSATDNGNAATFHRQHLDRGWDELGYHFVINNGSGGPDGRVEVGPRWRKQKHGAHSGGTPGNEYNEVGIGVCLVGNFQNRMPTRRQMAALQELVDHLMAAHQIPPNRVIAHRDAPGANTECCGRQLYNHLNVALRPSLSGGAYARR
jgi:N-acetyl-anhydromuramyl-L-alanine amidase AmpD